MIIITLFLWVWVGVCVKKDGSHDDMIEILPLSDIHRMCDAPKMRRIISIAVFDTLTCLTPLSLRHASSEQVHIPT